MALLSLVAAAAVATTPVPPPPSVSGNWSAEAILAARVDCTRLLAGLDVTAKPVPPIGSADSCGAPAPVEVTAIARVKLAPAATLTCSMVAALHHWVTGTLQPLAQSVLATRVTSIANASSYVCRSRNHIAGAKISEHARANALDMASFTYARADLPAGWAQWLGADGKPVAGSFIERVRLGACSDFTTVLGPGADVYHGDHFHLDMLVRKNGYRICQ
ncbi:extensin family protein [Polymorphobacter arshaanensis]|uniref:extensin-like domain-containing protein n=1 Tax=Glacieibacterium arshaanense TaxID=2511025 RepID=UPI0014076504|nr:extensin family protein [Polymorphobacter arshaanensis]